MGNNTIFANAASIAGHVHVGDYTILGGFTGVHQFVLIGAHSMTAGATLLLQDLPPYVMAAGNAAKPFGINAEGLKRRGFSEEQVTEIRRAYKTLYRSGLTLEEAKVAIVAQAEKTPVLKILADFLGRSTRGIVR